MKNKKAQSLGGLYSGILVIASIGILLALVLYILSSMGTSFLAANTAGIAVNESVTPTMSGVNLASAGLVDGLCRPITYVLNTTNNYIIAAGNYTQTGCLFSNSTQTCVGCGNNGWRVNYPYTYSADTNSSLATGTVITQFVNFLPWMGIILLVLAAGVVLFFVIRSFAGGGKGV